MNYNFPNLYRRAEVVIEELEGTDRCAFIGTIRDLVDCAMLLERVLKTTETLRGELISVEFSLDSIAKDAKETIGEKQ